MYTNDINRAISQAPCAVSPRMSAFSAVTPDNFLILLLHGLTVFQIEHLYGLTVFENYLYATNSDEGNLNPKTSVIRVNRFNSSDFQVVTRVDRGAALHVYHQRRQPQGTYSRRHNFALSIRR